jgi:hypothetical protein
VRLEGDATVGMDLERPVASVFDFDGGLARKARAYLDPQEALEAVGCASSSGLCAETKAVAASSSCADSDGVSGRSVNAEQRRPFAVAYAMHRKSHPGVTAARPR